MRLLSRALFVVIVAASGNARADEPGPNPSPEAAAEPVDESAAGPDGIDWAAVDETLRWGLEGDWLNPPGPFWEPRRGARTELSLHLGGEVALGELGTLDRIPSLGGTTLTMMGRYYPVDRLAIGVGVKSYAGVADPAPGTTAETVLTPVAGVRWDLVRENRFSLLADVASGPTMFLFADPLGALGAAWAVGGEAIAAATLRYTLGPFTAELRTSVGGRVGEAQEIGRPRFDVGPFSALYAGIDTGITWSFWAEGWPAKERLTGSASAALR